jgi:hypothetical protein
LNQLQEKADHQEREVAMEATETEVQEMVIVIEVQDHHATMKVDLVNLKDKRE